MSPRGLKRCRAGWKGLDLFATAAFPFVTGEAGGAQRSWVKACPPMARTFELQNEQDGPHPLCSLITFGDGRSAERAAVGMHGAHVGDHILSLTLQPAGGTPSQGGPLHPGLAAALSGGWVGPEW